MEMHCGTYNLLVIMQTPQVALESYVLPGVAFLAWSTVMYDVQLLRVVDNTFSDLT